jgi:hypothetical protein
MFLLLPINPPSPGMTWTEDKEAKKPDAQTDSSVPGEVKAAFDKTFGDQNKSAVIAQPMRRAIPARDLHKRPHFTWWPADN